MIVHLKKRNNLQIQKDCVYGAPKKYSLSVKHLDFNFRLVWYNDPTHYDSHSLKPMTKTNKSTRAPLYCVYKFWIITYDS